MLRKMIQSLSSLKLTIIVLTTLIVTSIPATLIPQNQGREFYLSHYPGNTGFLILSLGYHHFFSSLPFLILLGIFWFNLFSCTLKRFSKEIHKKERGRYGPDILHLGLLIMIVAAMISFNARKEGYVFMGAGDILSLPNGYKIHLDEFLYERYPDGRPKQWLSRGRISDSTGQREVPFEISVNKPLRIHGLVLYQRGYKPSDTAGEYETGLMVSSDPGKIYILLSFFFICGGLVLTFLQKRTSS